MVKQYTNYWCVPAATQTMWQPDPGTSRTGRYTRQQRYYTQIRPHNRYTYSTKGNDVAGLGLGACAATPAEPYYEARAYAVEDDGASTRSSKSLDRTGHPVGVTVHDGTHAWVVLGYKAQLDPTDPVEADDPRASTSADRWDSPTDPWQYRYMTHRARSGKRLHAAITSGPARSSGKAPTWWSATEARAAARRRRPPR